jgi:malonyl CoA-acyl carrier protein transacylase
VDKNKDKIMEIANKIKNNKISFSLLVSGRKEDVKEIECAREYAKKKVELDLNTITADSKEYKVFSPIYVDIPLDLNEREISVEGSIYVKRDRVLFANLNYKR